MALTEEDGLSRPDRKRASRRVRKRRLLVLVLAATAVAVILVLIVGHSSGTRRGAQPAADTRATVNLAHHKATNPSATPSVPSTSSTTTLATVDSPFGQNIQTYLSSRAGDVTAALYDVNSGHTWLFRPGEAQATASIVKVDVMATLLAQANESDQPVSAEDQSLLTSMIELSDNDAATTLWEAVGGPSAIESFNARAGLTQTTPSPCLSCANFPWPGWGLTTTTASDQVTLLRYLIGPNPLLSDQQRNEAIGLMENVTPSERWGVTGGVPSGVTVALKNGWVPLPDSLWQINSIGWIDGDGRNYLLAILSDGNPTESYGITTIDKVSSLVWVSMVPS